MGMERTQTTLFNMPESLAMPRNDMLSILALQKRENLIRFVSHYEKEKSTYSENDQALGLVIETAFELYLELQSLVKQHATPEEQKRVLDLLHSRKFEDLKELMMWFNDFMYQMNITKIDNIKRMLHPYSAEEDNAKMDF